MIEKLTNHIVDCQIASGKIKEEEGSVYRYGYTLFFRLEVLQEAGMQKSFGNVRFYLI